MATGRPTSFDPKYVKQGYKLALLGLTVEEMADVWEVNKDTVYSWQKKHEGFADALKRGRDEADANMVISLYKQGIGFTKKVKEPKVVAIGQGEGSEVEIIEYKKYFPPVTTAAIFWLKNRQPKRWRDKQEIDHTNNGGDFKPTERVIVLKDIDKPNISQFIGNQSTDQEASPGG